MGEVRTNLVLRLNDQATAGLKRVQASMAGVMGTFGRLAAGFTGLAGVGSVAGLGLMVKKAQDAGDQLQKLSQRLGVSTEALSQFKHMATLSGLEFNMVAKSIQKMMISVEKAKLGTGKEALGFAGLGIDPRSLTGMSPEQQFLAIAAAMDRVADANQRVTYAYQIFGQEGAGMLQMMAGGADNLKKSMDEIRDKGWIVTKEEADVMAATNDSISDMVKSLEALATTLAVNVGPAIQGVTKSITEATSKANSWLRLLPRLWKGETGADVFAQHLLGSMETAFDTKPKATPEPVFEFPPMVVPAGFFDGFNAELSIAQQNFNEKFGSMAAKGRETAIALNKALSGAFNDFFVDAIEGRLKQFKEYLMNFMKDIGRAMSQVLSQQIATQILTRVGTMAAGGGTGAQPAAAPARAKMMSPTVNIINNSGTPMEATASGGFNEIGESVMNIVIDSVYRNKGGSRDALRGMLA